MDFSKMSAPKVARIASNVCKALNVSGKWEDAYYKMHDNNVPVIYATVKGEYPICDVRVTIRVEAIELLAERFGLGQDKDF